ENVERIGNVVDARTIKEFAGGELNIEAVVHRRPGILRMETLKCGVVVPVAGCVGDVLQLGWPAGDERLVSGFGVSLHVEVADEEDVCSLAERIGISAKQRSFLTSGCCFGVAIAGF